MIGVAVRVERGDEIETELANERRVALMLFENGIDQHAFSRHRVREEIGVSAGDWVVELAKEHLVEVESYM